MGWLPLSGRQTGDLVELLSLFPTLAGLAGLRVPPRCPIPSFHMELCREGRNLLKLFEGRGEEEEPHVRGNPRELIAYSQYPCPFASTSVQGEIMITNASLVAQSVKNLPIVQEPLGSIPRSGRSPGEQKGNPLQYSCLENPMDRTARQRP